MPATMAWHETVKLRPVGRMTVVRLLYDTHPPSGDVVMREPFSRTSRPSNIQAMRDSGLLLDVLHSSETVSFTLASLGPVMVTVLGGTELIRSSFVSSNKNSRDKYKFGREPDGRTNNNKQGPPTTKANDAASWCPPPFLNWS